MQAAGLNNLYGLISFLGAKGLISSGIFLGNEYVSEVVAAKRAPVVNARNPQAKRAAGAVT